MYSIGKTTEHSYIYIGYMYLTLYQHIKPYIIVGKISLNKLKCFKLCWKLENPYISKIRIGVPICNIGLCVYFDWSKLKLRDPARKNF